ncbi:MAG: hypothetical protein IPK85_22270 [Gemmatimonadetes bacterium]|nr:hypothetical protein [Gemmatimonadota bacterium]
MTNHKDFKRVVRTRMQKTGESYTAARAATVARTRAPAARVAPEINYEQLAGMKDATISARTGRSWKEWTEELDAKKALEWTHTEIARHVHTALGVGHWWAQTVTVGYERIKGLRAIGQRRSGTFEVNKSRTFAVDIAMLYAAFENARRRARWLTGVKLVVRKAVTNKSIRITWPDGTSVEGWFMGKGPNKSTVSVQHTKLPDREAVTRARTFWGERLDALAELLGNR